MKDYSFGNDLITLIIYLQILYMVHLIYKQKHL